MVLRWRLKVEVCNVPNVCWQSSKLKDQPLKTPVHQTIAIFCWKADTDTDTLLKLTQQTCVNMTVQWQSLTTQKLQQINALTALF